MAEIYDHKEIEKKWQGRWEKDKAFRTPTLRSRSVKKGKMYVLDMFPYPSGDGLHVGHVKIYAAADIYARYQRMRGYSVLHPTGWDAFGLPTENSAIKFGIHPATLTARNTDRFRAQMQAMGFSYDWEREINTTDPEYYRWTQWIFLQLFKRGLAYKATIPINWCPKDKTGLANEEVVAGKCERCGTAVEQRPVRQWILKITQYANRLLEDLEDLQWPGFILEMQRNWIGRSTGATIRFEVAPKKEKGKKKPDLEVFTTRPDTLFGVTYMVVAPEHPLIEELKDSIENYGEVQKYVEAAKNKTELQRKEEEKEKTGVELRGIRTINPGSGEEIPVWAADYVLMNYGTGAIMAVPAHDERDREFAEKFGLPIKHVVDEESEEAKKEMIKRLEGKGAGKVAITYKLKDWVFSRQRYWGEPIPIVHCEKCGVVPVPEKDLPVKLPEVEHYEPTGTGESPLANIDSWVNTTCPACAGRARRETNTMPQWAGSSWYYLRYIDPKNKKKLADAKKEKAWMPVDVYIGGAEHAVLHLLYARFWHKVLYDAGIVSTKEPFKQLRNVGLVMGADGQKMSKSRGNVVNPDGEIEAYGADATRIFSMFMGPFDSTAAWTTEGIQGAHRFVKRVWNVFGRVLSPQRPPDPAVPTSTPRSNKKTSKAGPLLGVLGSDSAAPPASDSALQLKLQQTIQRVTDSTENFRFNTAISAFMEFLNELEKQENVAKETLETFVLLMAPYAPHLAEELWEKLGHKNSLAHESWPEADENILKSAQATIPVQVNGKVRAVLTADQGLAQDEIEKLARAEANVAKHLAQGTVKKVVYVPDKLLNFVVK